MKAGLSRKRNGRMRFTDQSGAYAELYAANGGPAVNVCSKKDEAVRMGILLKDTMRSREDFADACTKAGFKADASKVYNSLLATTQTATNEYATPIYAAVNYEELKAVVEKNFPGAMRELNAALAVIAQLLLEDVSEAGVCILVGPPSGRKTTTLGFLYGHPLIEKQDNFTVKCFVTHAATVSKEELGQIDLLPKIKNRCLVTPELAPLFNKNREELMEALGLLTRLFDCEGLQTSSGVRGTRGYQGDYRFSFLAATTPIDFRVWKSLGKLGSRWLFLNVTDRNRDEEDLASDVTNPRSYKERKEECRQATHNFLTTLFEKHGGSRHVTWERKEREHIKRIVRLAKFLAHARGEVDIWSVESNTGEKVYDYSMPIIEKPERLTNLLYNFARGHALTQGRLEISDVDLPLLIEVVLSSMPHDRARLVHLLLDKGGTVTTEQVMADLDVSNSTARRLMKLMEVLDVGDLDEWPDSSTEGGRRPLRLTLKPEFKWLLSNEFNSLRERLTNPALGEGGDGKTTPHTPQSVTKTDVGEGGFRHETGGVSGVTILNPEVFDVV